MFGLDDYASAIGSIESGNNYGTLGPATKNGDRAYGRYQVMGSNIGPWTKQYYGTELNPHQFLNNPEAQDAVFHGEFGRAVSKYGNPQDAAAVWFSGRPLAQSANSDDGYINTNEYVNRFNKALGVSDAPAAAPAATPAAPPQEAPMGLYDNAPDNSGGNLFTGLSGLGAGLVTAANPGAGAALQQNFNQMMLANRPKPQVITDMFGQQHIVAIDPRTGQPIQNAKALAAARGGSGTGSDFGDFADNLRSYQSGKMSGEDLLKNTPQPVVDLARAYVSGTGDPRLLGMGRQAAGMRSAAISLAHVMDPTFTENDIDTRKKMATSMGDTSPQSMGGQINSANTLMGHLSGMLDATDRLEKLGVATNVPIFNKLMQFGTTQIPGLIKPDVQAAIQDYNQHLQAVGGELTKITRGGNGSLKEVEDWKNGAHASDSLAAMRASASAGVDLMHSRLQANVDAHNRAFHQNRTAEDFMSDPAKAALDRVAQGNYLTPSTNTPSQSIPKVGSPSEAMRLPKGSKFYDPNGVLRTVP